MAGIRSDGREVNWTQPEMGAPQGPLRDGNLVGRARFGDDALDAPEDRGGLTGIPEDIQFSDLDLMTPEEIDNQGALGLDAGVPSAPPDHNENLAEIIALMPDGESYLSWLGQTLSEMYDADLASRADWEKRFKRGLEIIGITDWTWGEGGAPFEGASDVVHPMMAEAGVQSQARAVEELCPAKGPAKALVMGIETPEKRAAADRVADHMNYQLTIEDPVYTKETNKLHLYNTWFGTAYRKALHDPITDRNLLRFVKGSDLILPYDATSLDTSPRATHRFPLTENDFKIYVKNGAFRDIELAEPTDPERDEETEALDEADGKEESRHDDDIVYQMRETDIALDLQGFEDPDGISLPYIVTWEHDSQKVLAIRRGWKKTDPLKLRRTRYAEYWYLPGLGAYGYGLLHMIGSLQAAATDALRSLLDSAAFSTMQGGFKSKDANVKAGELELKMGVWQDVDMSADELQKAFYTPPFNEPSQAIFSLLGTLEALGRRFAATTDLMVGEGTKGPVGTTIAMLEQGQKVYSSIHKRGHAAVGQELLMLFDLNSEYIPEEGYPYAVPGDDLEVFKADYDTTLVGIVPVSDPNIFSQTQRIAQGQALYTLYTENKQDFKRHEVLRRVLESLKTPDIEAVLIDIEKGPPSMDPVSENIAIMTQRPVKAKEGENHYAHLAVLMSFAQHPQFGGIPQAQDIIMPAVIAHAAEHLALLYADTMRQMGVQVPQQNLSAGPGGDAVEEIPPEMQAQIAQAAWQMIGQFMQSSGLVIPPEEAANDELAAAEVKLKQAQGFSAFGKGVLDLTKAKQTMMSGAAGLAGLDEVLNSDAQMPQDSAPAAVPMNEGPAEEQPAEGAIPL